MSKQSFPITKPSLYDVCQQLKEDVFSTLRVCVPGEVVSFDGTKRTAVVKVLLKRSLPNGTLVDYKQLLDVPVITYQGGGGFLQFPIAAGDQGLVIFADRNIGSWFQNGDNSPMPDLRAHNISDGFFLPGINALTDGTLPDYPTDRVVLGYMGSKFEVTAAGWNFVGDGGAEIDLAGEIVTIKNNTTTLLTLMNGLIGVIEALQVNGPIPLTAASIAALEAYKLTLATLIA